MSSQKGNIARSRGQRYQNTTAFKNDRNGATLEIKKANAKIHDGLCLRCKDVLEWKVKYKKYKSLTTAKKCVKCSQKTVKDAYHIICKSCALRLEICCKCGKKEEIVIPNDNNILDSHLEKNEQEETNQCTKKQEGKKRAKEDCDSDQSDGFDDDDDDDDDGEEDEDCDLSTKKTQWKPAVLPDVSQMNVKE
ncbi:uncharacterized protein C9orf85 homolog isoform X1 [Gouania willdenowi]|uniref:Uncharacterized protein n=1 Tax=Gouania willdenowi TaxID=441366 RepID=A0A8C5GF87_GOUWI|nr:uncharacterized protein C9orf85 homolog isoform X1 [Gouania willdenowi]